MTRQTDHIVAANRRLLVEGDLDAVTTYFAADFVAHMTERDMAGGSAAVRRFVSLLRASFDHLEVAVEVLVESGDRVAWQRTLHGTHTKAFAGFPATGKRIVWRDMVTSRFAEGLFAEDWSISDLAEQLLRARH